MNNRAQPRHKNMTKNTGSNWRTFLDAYSAMNAGRRTRLGIFEMNKDVVNDYWIEDGLPLVGLSVEADGAMHSVQIMIGEMTHSVRDAVKLTVHFTNTGYEDGLDILDRDHRMTILRFEK